MVQIETENGVFAGESLRDATAQARRAKRVADKADRVRAANAAQARLVAASNGVRLYEWLAEVRHGVRDALPRGIRLVASRVTARRHRVMVTRYETETGTGDFEHYGYAVVGVVENGAGFAMATMLSDLDRDAKCLCAVGVCEAEVVMLPLEITHDELMAALADR